MNANSDVWNHPGKSGSALGSAVFPPASLGGTLFPYRRPSPHCSQVQCWHSGRPPPCQVPADLLGAGESLRMSFLECSPPRDHSMWSMNLGDFFFFSTEDFIMKATTYQTQTVHLMDKIVRGQSRVWVTQGGTVWLNQGGRDWEQMSVYRRTGKEVVVHIRNGIVLSHKKEWNCIICRDVDGPRKYHIEWSSQEEKTNILYQHICVEIKNMV